MNHAQQSGVVCGRSGLEAPFEGEIGLVPDDQMSQGPAWEAKREGGDEVGEGAPGGSRQAVERAWLRAVGCRARPGRHEPHAGDNLQALIAGMAHDAVRLLPVVGPGEEFDDGVRAHFARQLQAPLNLPFPHLVDEARMHAKLWQARHHRLLWLWSGARFSRLEQGEEQGHQYQA